MDLGTRYVCLTDVSIQYTETYFFTLVMFMVQGSTDYLI